ncbi:MAG: hypothetical protein AAF267_18550, partial [Deinococcota bacterium]
GKYIAPVIKRDFRMNQNETSDPQAVLAEVFEFSAADIAANSRGNLSAAQKARMTRKHHADARAARSIFVIIFGLGLLGFSAEMIRIGNMGVRSVLTYFLVMAFFGFIAWGFILHNRHQLSCTLREGNAQPVKGEIQLITKRSERAQVRYFCVGSHRFRIDGYLHFVLLQNSGVAGREAIVYVSAPWYSVLSVVLQT